MFNKQSQTQTKKTNKKREKVTIGSGWSRSGKNGDYISITFKGGYENDNVEVILRSKSDGTELNLSENGGIIFPNGFKEKDNQPDVVIQAYLPEDKDA